MPKLYLIPTPIGNLEDITYRAVRVLKEEVDQVLAEDTRVTKKLFTHYGIDKPMTSHHQKNEHATASKWAERVRNGERIAFVSDAGTPGISDPGYLLVRECLRAGVEVETLPGPVAFIPALVNSGIPCDRFLFEGFLPHKKGRTKRLKQLAEEERTIVLYESPHRVLKTLEQLKEYVGPTRRISLSREITKIHEENKRGTIEEVLQELGDTPPKGEMVLIVAGTKSKMT